MYAAVVLSVVHLQWDQRMPTRTEGRGPNKAVGRRRQWGDWRALPAQGKGEPPTCDCTTSGFWSTRCVRRGSRASPLGVSVEDSSRLHFAMARLRLMCVRANGAGAVSGSRRAGPRPVDAGLRHSSRWEKTGFAWFLAAFAVGVMVADLPFLRGAEPRLYVGTFLGELGCN